MIAATSAAAWAVLVAPEPRTLLTLGCAALAVALLATPASSPICGSEMGPLGPVGRTSRLRARGARWPPRPRPRVLALVVLLGVGGFVLATPRQVVLLAIVTVAGRAGVGLWRRRRATREAEQTSTRLLEACEQLTGELVAGRPPGAALEHCASEWRLVAPVAEAFRVGADVPGAWRQAAHEPGAQDLRLVAAAWQVSHRTGSGLAGALEHVTLDLRAQHATRRVVAGELASARATARMVAVLPVLALTFGSGAGGDPWGFLLGHPIGLGCLGLGLAFAITGLAWIEALARQVDGR